MSLEFTQYLSIRAKEKKKTILMPESDERIIKAASICVEKKIAKIVLFGKKEKLQASMQEKGYYTDNDLIIVDPEDIRSEFVDSYYELRKHKNITLEGAKEALKDNMTLAMMMLYDNRVDGLVAGASTSTADTIRPAFQIIKAKKGYSLVSSSFFMCFNEGVKLFSDCAVNPNPDAQELAQIAIQTAETAREFEIDPLIAMISYSTGASGKGQDVEKVKEAVDIIKKLKPELQVDGPLQYDAAINTAIAKKKAPDSKVAGKASILIFPDLNTGNSTYKAVQQSAQIVCVGPLLQGMNKPVNDLSRGASVEDIVYTVALTAIQA